MFRGKIRLVPPSALMLLKSMPVFFGDAVRARQKILFATGHPAGLFPMYAELARVAERAGATVLRIEQGERFWTAIFARSWVW